MRTKRLLGAVAAGTIAAIAPLSATIAAAEDANGVGTATVSSTLLQVDVGTDGSVLHVRVLGDDGTSTIDPAAGSPSASTSISPLTISSGLVPALNHEVTAVSSTSSGTEDSQTVSPAMPNVPAFAGSLTATLSSIVDAAGARSGVDAAVSNLSVAGGLLHIPTATAVLGSNAATGSASAVRSISIPEIEVLNLGAVLEGAGLPLSALDLDALFGLLASLGIELPELPDPAELVTTLDAAIDGIEDETGPLTAEVCAAVDGLLGQVGGLTGTGDVVEAVEDVVEGVTGGGTAVDAPSADVPLLGMKVLPTSCDDLTGTVEDLVDDLQTLLSDLLTSVLATLEDTALLSVEGIQVGLVADATSTVEGSVAAVTGTIGSVKVGELTVPGISGLDLTAGVDILNAAGETVSGAIGSVLAVVNAELADMVDVDVLAITESVTPDGDYIDALSEVTAVKATLKPAGLLNAALDVTGTVGDVLGELETAVPALSPVMGELETALGGLDLLTDVTTITVGQMTSASTFRPVAATVPGSGTAPTGELPRTGSDAALPAIAAVLVAGVALGIRRFVAAVTA